MGSQGPAIGVQEAAGLMKSSPGKQGSGIAEPERTVNVDRKHCKDLTKERA